MYYQVEVVTENGIQEISKERQENFAYFSIDNYLKSLDIKPITRRLVNIDDNKTKVVFNTFDYGYFYVTKKDGWLYKEQDESITIYPENERPEFKGYNHMRWCTEIEFSDKKKRLEIESKLNDNGMYFYVDEDLSIKVKEYKSTRFDVHNMKIGNMYLNSGEIKYDDIKKWEKYYENKKSVDI